MSEASSARGAETLLELGCGPVISHALPFVPYVSSFILSDYLDSNLDEIRKWVAQEPNAHNWSLHTALIMKREGLAITPAGILARENILRKKLSSLVVGDLLSKKPIRRQVTFPVVTCFYASEQAASDESEWLEVVQNLSSLVSPGGLLYLVCVRDSEYYAIHDRDHTALRIPIAPITQRLVEKGLRNAGFSLSRTVIHSADVQGIAEEGLNGILLIKSRKAD